METRRAVDTDLRVLYGLFGIAGSAFIPFYALLLRQRGLSPDEIGVMLAITSLAGVASTPFWSHAADTRLGTVDALQLACAGGGVAAIALMATGSSPLAIAGVAAVLGAAQGPQTAMTDALTLTQLGPTRISEYGTFRLWMSIGWGVGAIAFGALFSAAGLRFVLPAYAAGIALYALYVSRLPRARPAPVDTGSRLGAVGEALRRAPRLLPFLIGVLVLATSTHAAWDFVPLRIVSRGGGAFLVGAGAGVSAFVEIPFMRWSRSLVERVGLRVVFAAGASVYAAASVAWAIVDDPAAVAIVRIAIGVGFGFVYVTLVVMTGRLVPARVRNSGQALLSMCSFGIAPVIGGAVGGVVYEHVGPAQLFAASAVGIVVGTVLVYAAVRGIDDHDPSAVPD